MCQCCVRDNYLFVNFSTPPFLLLSCFWRFKAFSFSNFPIFYEFYETSALQLTTKSYWKRSFFWSLFSHIRTEYGEIFRENTDQKKLRIWTLFTQCWWHLLVCSYIIEGQKSQVLDLKFELGVANIKKMKRYRVCILWSVLNFSSIPYEKKYAW